MFFRMTGVQTVFDVAVQEVLPGELRLTDGRTFPFRYAMVVPPFLGAEVVRASGVGNPRGFIDVKDTYQTLDHPNVYAVDRGRGERALEPGERGRGAEDGVPVGDDGAGGTIAHIASQIRGEEPIAGGELR